MIKYIQKKNGKIEVLDNPSDSDKFWVQVVNPNVIELEQLAADFELDAGKLKDVLDSDEMPRFDNDNNNSYIFSRYAHRSSGGHITTLPVLFVITKDILISINQKHFYELEDILENQNHLTTNNSNHLLLPMINKCLQSYEMHLSTIGRQIRTARNSLKDEKFSNKHFVRFVEIEDLLNDFLSELVPINNILLHLLSGRKVIRFTNHDRDSLEDIQLANAQLIDECKGYLKTIVNIREAYSNIMTNNLNRQIKILTTLTIVLTVPTIVGSFFGMNVPLPLQHNSAGFFIIFGVTMTIAITVLLILKKKDWL